MNQHTSGKFVSCRVGPLFLGIALEQVQEINRMVDATFVPRLQPEVRGLVNLRGALVTVLDLGVILHEQPSQSTGASRCVIVRLGEEMVGLCVDRVGDVLDCSEQEIEPLPSHLERANGRCFQGVVQLDTELLLVLDVDAVVAPTGRSTQLVGGDSPL